MLIGSCRPLNFHPVLLLLLLPSFYLAVYGTQTFVPFQLKDDQQLSHDQKHLIASISPPFLRCSSPFFSFFWHSFRVVPFHSFVFDPGAEYCSFVGGLRHSFVFSLLLGLLIWYSFVSVVLVAFWIHRFVLFCLILRFLVFCVHCFLLSVVVLISSFLLFFFVF